MTSPTTDAVIANGLEAMAKVQNLMGERARIDGRPEAAAGMEAYANTLAMKAQMTRAGIVGVVEGEGR